MLLSVLQYTGQPPQQRIIQPQMLIVPCFMDFCGFNIHQPLHSFTLPAWALPGPCPSGLSDTGLALMTTELEQENEAPS